MHVKRNEYIDHTTGEIEAIDFDVGRTITSDLKQPL